MKNWLINLKWRMLLGFFGISLATLVAAYYCWSLLIEGYAFGKTEFWLISAFLVLLNPVIGYVTARKYERRLDELHLAIKQAATGNLSVRLPAGADGQNPDDELFMDFNKLMDGMEEKMKTLRRLGEEQVKRQIQSNEAAVLEERKRLARDLHDTVSQQLFAIHMSASSLEKLMDQKPEAAREVIAGLVNLSQHAQRQMRGLIAQLRPLELENKSLPEALEQWFPDFCRQNGLQGELDVQIADRLPETVEHQLFLTIQEGMANIVKHARARNVRLSLSDAGRQYVMTLTDDGVGFRVDEQNGSSYGLQTMRERAQKLGGEMKLLSKLGMGTTVKVQIPKLL